MKSLDPRVKRLPVINTSPQEESKTTDHQFATFEVFVQPKEGKAYQHEGAVHAPNLEMAYVLAKETFTRRFLCYSLCLAETSNIYVSVMTDGQQSAYDLIPDQDEKTNENLTFEIYHLLKRGKQHVHVGNVKASSPESALTAAKQSFNLKSIVFNIWAIRTNDIRYTSPEDANLWATLPDKKFRDASDYKGGQKLTEFLKRTNQL